jgi:hypothetical protein
MGPVGLQDEEESVAAAVPVKARRRAGDEGVSRKWRSEAMTWSRARGQVLSGAYGEELLRFKARDLDGHPGRWTVEDLDVVLLEVFPAKVIVESEAECDPVLEEVKAFLRFMAETGRLHPDSDDPETLCLHLDGLAPIFQLRMADPSRYGWGKRMALVMARDGVAANDEKAVKAWMARFDALPLAEQAALLDSFSPVG